MDRERPNQNAWNESLQYVKSKAFLELLSFTATAVMAIVAVVGLPILKAELEQISTQNRLLERSIGQTFRPLGVVGENHGDSLRVGFSRGNLPGTFSMVWNPTIINVGQGPMFLLGYLHLVSDKRVDFRSELLANKIDTIGFDGMFSSSREKPILSGEKFDDVTVQWLGLPFQSEYSLHVLYLYKDQAGNLFDTQAAVTVRMKGAHGDSAGKIVPEVDGAVSPHESFHEYLSTERELLKRVLKEKGGLISEFI